VDAEDYLGVTDTYPEHPLTGVSSRCKTETELRALRKKQENVDI